MRLVRRTALAFLALVALLSVTAGFFAPHDYVEQFREHPDEAPSAAFPLGTDELGRDRFSRLLRAIQVSFLLAPATAIAAMGIAAAAGVAAALRGGWLDALLTAGMDLFQALPWLFALLTLRAVLPLNVSPGLSLVATAGLLAFAGWAPSARVLRAGVGVLRESPPILHARAAGCSEWRIVAIHLLPNIRPVLKAQFWMLVPVFLLTEANLGLLGLGVAEPLPSMGNLLSELQHYHRIPDAPWILAPAALLVAVVASLHLAFSGTRTWE